MTIERRGEREDGTAAGPAFILALIPNISHGGFGRAVTQTSTLRLNHPHSIPAMALNWAMIDEERTPVPLPFEMNIKRIQGAELILTLPDGPPSGPATSGGSGGAKKMKSNGEAWLTDQRVE